MNQQPVASFSQTFTVLGGEYVTVELNIEGSLTSRSSGRVRDRVVLAVAKSIAVDPLRVSIVSLQDSARRLLQLSIVLRIIAASSADAQTLVHDVMRADMAAEMRAQGLQITVSSRLLLVTSFVVFASTHSLACA
jgi:hypothetical protein